MKRVRSALASALMIGAGVWLTAPFAKAGQVFMNGLAIGAGTATMNVESFQHRKFGTTIEQEYDFSCGSAALATLLSFSYHQNTSEADVFADMFKNGDQALIRQYGFSLLDMKNYLSRINLASGGFKAPLSKLEAVRLPAIVLINEHGYRHFVVIRGIQNDKVLLADPALGLRTERLSVFQQEWSGIFFIILDNISLARTSFNDGHDWSEQPDSPVDLSRFAIDLSTLEQVTFPQASRF